MQEQQRREEEKRREIESIEREIEMVERLKNAGGQSGAICVSVVWDNSVKETALVSRVLEISRSAFCSVCSRLTAPGLRFEGNYCTYHLCLGPHLVICRPVLRVKQHSMADLTFLRAGRTC